MGRFIDVQIKHEPYVNSINDVSLKIKITRKATSQSVDCNRMIILDDNGKEYVLTFCYIDYGAGRPYEEGPSDCVDVYSLTFRVDVLQFQTLTKIVEDINDSAISYKSLKDTLQNLKINESEVEYLINFIQSIDSDDNDNISGVYAFLNKMPI